MQSFIPHVDSPKELEKGPVAGVRGGVVGALAGSLIGAALYYFWGNYWVFALVPFATWAGYAIRPVSKTSDQLALLNVLW